MAAFAKTPGESWTDRTLKKLSLRDKIAQLIQIRVPGKFLNRRSDDFRKIRDQIRQNHVGGVVLFAGNVYESAILLNELQHVSRLPLLVSADFERGASFRIADTTSFPWAMALGAAGSEQFAYQEGLITAHESRALGVHWIFAPVLDVNNNPNNPVINIRSFGEDPGLVSRLGSAFIRGARDGGVLTTAKHFPGHGDTATDSHLGLAVVQSDMNRLQSLELVPFKSAIEAGVDSIMTAHVAVPKVTGDSRTPATLSPKILTDLLRNSLHFKGLVVTDALEMGGITNTYWCGLAAVRALQAGADVLLLPTDATVAINEVERAVKRGDLSERQINESVRKILTAKRRLGLLKLRTVDIGRISEVIASPQSVGIAQDIADRSITVVKDESNLLPVDPTNYPRVFSLVLTPDLESSPASTFQAEMRQRFPLIKTAWANARISDELVRSIEKAAAESDLIVCSTLTRLVSGQNTAALPPNQRILFDKLLALHKPLIWVAFGNPYLLQLAPQVGTYLCAFSYSDVSQTAAAKAISGEIAVTGRMPVSIPGFSKAGDGQTKPMLDMVLKPVTPEASGPMKLAFEASSELLNSLVREKVFPGGVLLAGYRGEILFQQAAGRTGFSGKDSQASPDTIYDIGSLSKTVGISSAIMLAADSGRLLLDASVKDYVPEINHTAAAGLRVQDLLRSAGNEDLLKTIVTRAAGIPSERFLAEQFFTPLGMTHTFFGPPRAFRGTIARREEAQNPGLFSSAGDLAVFAQMLLNRGIYKHRRFFNLDTLGKFTGARGPWSKPSDSDWTGSAFSNAAFGHSEASGSLLWIEPAKKLFIVLLANGRPDDGRVADAQGKICQSILSAIPK